jgi:hypothetical protein
VPPLADPSHGLALALGGRCPLCAEIATDSGVLALRPCSICGGVFGDASLADAVVQAYEARSRERLWFHLLALAGAGFVLGFVPLLGAACLAIAFLFFQLRVVSPALGLFSRRRRAVSRWTLRLGTATVGVLTAVIVTIASLTGTGGFVTSVSAPASLAVTWLCARAYLLWQMRRERRNASVAGLEIVLLLGTLALVVVAAIAVVGLVAAALGLARLAIEKVLPYL